MTVEHGQANNRWDDYASVAYWYQDAPAVQEPNLPPPGQRLTEEMKERLIVVNVFEKLAFFERQDDFDLALTTCEKAMAEIDLFFYRELFELKKGALLFRAGRKEEAQVWLRRTLSHQTHRPRRALAEAMLEVLEDPAKALLIASGDDIFVLEINNKREIVSDIHEKWGVAVIDIDQNDLSLKAQVYNMGFFGGLALGLFHRDGVLVTDDSWIVSGDDAQDIDALKKSENWRAAQIYGYPAFAPQSPSDLNVFHFLGADIRWIWSRTNYLEDETLYLYRNYSLKDKAVWGDRSAMRR